MALLTFMLGGRIYQGRCPTGWGTQPLQLLVHPAISLIAVRILRLYKVVLRRNEEILWS